MTKKSNTGFKRIIKAAGFSWQGLTSSFKSEAAFRQEVFMAAILIPLAFYLDVSQVERILMISAVVLVMVVELINTAIEAVVDRIGSEHHELSGMAKDVGSAAVLICLILAGYVWLEILFL
ncbi:MULTISPECIES: diacylglycerol kinase [Vibrio]|jgi:diacylglycerol kinase (ATP)|uniref:Diacylglycerol kinase n=4 Tax=Vibrio cyclitrophicus TaxID=47951 RepID=A0A7Z1ME37_9VIBR|nr:MULTISPECIES: diacylglycerol kinase [Vibrio]KNH11652.1 diacylglycerol kinase [Vibrio lentus]MBY7663094.1 diacylglycerol kinase [Vibrio atlanticus]ERM59731.1 Diacylglycerol kinase [Vibrio cyclitrophicus FF75]KAA8596380.1 Diacylglycerol kinase [Vibrio cyclitrophicus]MBE8554857.1 diacylglycerol kinase [Vibrio sp. OPT24]